MSTNEQIPLSQPTSAVRNTLGKEQATPDSVRPISNEALREYCDKNYHQILPIIAEKVHKEKVQQEKLKAVKARLNFEETSTKAWTFQITKEEGFRKRNNVQKVGKYVFHRLGGKEKNVSAHSRDSGHRSYYSNRRDTKSCYQSSRSRETEVASEEHRHKREYSQRTKALSESKGSAGGHWKSKPKKQKSSIEDDLSQPWVCEETDPFTPRICYFDFPRTRMSSHIKRNARVWFDDLPKESIDSYDDLREAFLENYLQQKKCIKDPVEIHNINQKDGESTKEFVQRYKLECRDVKRAPECMKISEFMHEITNPELIKRLHDKIPKSVDEMTRVTMAFLREEVAASNRERKKLFPS
ncbi:reverse transcriptase domain-containing protein [Tanacetum coccineum]